MHTLIVRRISDLKGDGLFLQGGADGHTFKKGFVTSFSGTTPMLLQPNSTLAHRRFANYAVRLEPRFNKNMGLCKLPNKDFWCAVPPCSTPMTARGKRWLGCFANACLERATQNAKLVCVHVPGKGLLMHIHLLRDVYVPPGEYIEVLILYDEGKYTEKLRAGSMRSTALAAGRIKYGVGIPLIACTGCFTARPKSQTRQPCPNKKCVKHREKRRQL